MTDEVVKGTVAAGECPACGSPAKIDVDRGGSVAFFAKVRMVTRQGGQASVYWDWEVGPPIPPVSEGTGFLPYRCTNEDCGKITLVERA
jgi:hypothetical protein